MLGDMSDNRLKEFEVISQERRQGVDLYLKGLVIFLGLYSVGIKAVFNAKDRASIGVLAVSGVAILAFSHAAIWKSVAFERSGHARLEQLSRELGFAAPYGFRFLYLAVWGLVAVLSVIWLAASLYRLCSPS